MRILIVSDTHRKHENLKRVLENVSPVDLLIHLGDAEGYEDVIGEMAGCPLEIVAGNNDFFSRSSERKRNPDWKIPCLDDAWTLLLCDSGESRILSGRRKREAWTL